MDWKEIFVVYGPDILLLIVNVVLYILLFVFTKLVTKIRDKCIKNLTDKETKFLQRDDSIRRELDVIREENAALKKEMTQIRTAIIHVSEVEENGQNKKVN